MSSGTIFPTTASVMQFPDADVLTLSSILSKIPRCTFKLYSYLHIGTLGFLISVSYCIIFFILQENYNIEP